MAAVVGGLPFGLAEVITPTVLGFAIINGFTFAVDITSLVALRSGLGWPVPLAITLAYVTAFGLSYALNRALNFRSHAAVGPQLAVLRGCRGRELPRVDHVPGCGPCRRGHRLPRVAARRGLR